MIYYEITYAVPQSRCYTQSEIRGGRLIKYLYMYTSFFRNEKGQSRNKSVIVGRVSETDPTLFHPNDKYFAITGTAIPQVVLDKKEERKAKKQKRGSKITSISHGVPVVNGDVVKGSSLILKKIFENTGLSDCIKKIFDKKESDYLTATACLIASGDSTMSNIDDFSKTFVFDEPEIGSVRDLTISRLFSLCEQEDIDSFFELWLKKHMDLNEAICYDVTSFSSYAQEIQHAEFGYNRDKEDLPQVNLGMFSSIKSKKPLYYSMYNGSLNDSTQLPYVINDAKRLGISTRNVCTFDRGFFSQKGITFLDNAGLKIIVGVSLSRYKQALEVIEALSNSQAYRLPKYELSEYPGIYGHRIEHTIEDVKGVLHIYHDMNKCYDDNKILSQEVAAEIEKIKEVNDDGMPITQRKAKSLCKFHNCIKDDSNPCGYVFKEDEDKIIKAQKLLGFFALFTTNSDLSGADVLSAYRHKDVQEKIFDTAKNTLDCDRLKIHNSNTARGKMFVIFMALVVHSFIQEVINKLKVEEPKRFIKMTYEKLLRELDDISIKRSKSDIFLTKALTKTQKIILGALGVDLSAIELV